MERLFRMSKKEIPTDTEGKLQQLRNDILFRFTISSYQRSIFESTLPTALWLWRHNLWLEWISYKSLVENKIADAIKHAGLTIQELGKEHLMQKNIANAEKYTSKFLQELDDVETELNRQINYLGQVFMVFFIYVTCVKYTRNRMNSKIYTYIEYVTYVWLHIFY